jgi:hypothetical protein
MKLEPVHFARIFSVIAVVVVLWVIFCYRP